MGIDQLFKYSKKEIRSNQKLADFFSLSFKQEFGRDAKFCCSFTDYDKLKRKLTKTTPEIMSTLNRYEVKYPAKKILKYRDEKGIMRRLHAGKADDPFIEQFVKNHNPDRYPKIEKNIIELDAKPEKQTVAQIKELIKNANFEELEKYANDERKGVQDAYNERLKELQNDGQ
jgi:hypothetical protein